jgi:hypothetical protein
LYFIGEPDNDSPVKIGYSAWPVRRLSALQVASPVDLAILAKIWCLSQWEKELHEVFRDSRVRGEWFRRTPKLMRVIDAAASNDFGRVVNVLYEDYEPSGEDAVLGADQVLLITDDGDLVDVEVPSPSGRVTEMRQRRLRAAGYDSSRHDAWIEPDATDDCKPSPAMHRVLRKLLHR